MSPRFYTVRQGDTFQSLASRLGLAGIDPLLAVNPHKQNLRGQVPVFLGEVLTITMPQGRRLDSFLGALDLDSFGPFILAIKVKHLTLDKDKQIALLPNLSEATYRAAAWFFHELHPERDTDSLTNADVLDLLTIADTWARTIRQVAPYTNSTEQVNGLMAPYLQIPNSSWKRAAFSMASQFYIAHEPGAVIPNPGMSALDKLTLATYINIAHRFFQNNLPYIRDVCPDGYLSNPDNPLSPCEMVSPTSPGNTAPQDPSTLPCALGLQRNAAGQCVPVVGVGPCGIGLQRNAAGLCVPAGSLPSSPPGHATPQDPSTLPCALGLQRNAAGQCVPFVGVGPCGIGLQRNAAGLCVPTRGLPQDTSATAPGPTPDTSIIGTTEPPFEDTPPVIILPGGGGTTVKPPLVAETPPKPKEVSSSTGLWIGAGVTVVALALFVGTLSQKPSRQQVR